MSKHAVVVEFQSGSQDVEQFYTLEDNLEEAISLNEVGKYDGQELETSRYGLTEFLQQWPLNPEQVSLWSKSRHASLGDIWPDVQK